MVLVFNVKLTTKDDNTKYNWPVMNVFRPLFDIDMTIFNI